MHIVIIADAIDSQNAGIHYYTKNLIENLLKIDSKNRYSFIHSRQHPFFENKEHYIVDKKKGLGSESIRRFIRMPKVIRRLKPDIVLEPCHIGPFNLPKNIKRAVTIHDITPILFPHFHTARGRLVHKLLLKNSLKNADLILTPSQTTKTDILERYNTKNNIKVTPLGAAPPTPSNQVPAQTPYILYLGTIEPRKNLEILVEAFNELALNNYKLILAGGIGWKNKALLEKIKSNSNILLTDYLTAEQKAEYLSHANLFIYPSLYEGFGLPPLEAMSYGIPVITSTGGSLQEFFSDTALTFDPHDKAQLKNHILAIINNPSLRQTLITKGHQFSKEFSWQKTAKLTLSALEQL